MANTGSEDTSVEILKSTAMIGGSSLVNVVLGIVRNKALALLLGPTGVGLISVYASIADVAQSLTGMGIQSSGVRQIAEAAGSLDSTRIARTAAVLRRVAVALGAIGACVVIAAAAPVSRFTFGSDREAASVALLGFVVLLREVSAGQNALIQGMRRISDLARINVLSALFGTAITVAFISFGGAEAIVPSLIAVALVTVLTSFRYSSRIRIERAHVPMAQLRQETATLLNLGFAFMATGFLTMGAAYAVRIIVLRRIGIDGAGLYQASWALGGLYVSFVLQSMGADFYPRLTAVAKDNTACNRMVNEQAYISLLLAGPGVIATLTLAPFVLAGFYSEAFGPAVPMLRWICLGMILRVVSWPMGFIIVAKGAQNLMIATEVAAAAVHVGLAWMLVPAIGLDGAGVAFCGLYVWHGLLVYALVRRVSGFRWSAQNRTLGIVFLPLTALVFGSFYVLPAWLAITVGLVSSCLAGLYSVQTLLTLIPAESTPRVVRSWLSRLAGSSRVPVLD